MEKSRISSQAKGERNYHIFYQLFEAQHLKRRYGLSHPENYRYTNQSGCVQVVGVNDRQEHDDVVIAMRDLGFSEEEKEWIFDVVAAVLFLGNIEFATKKIKGTTGSQITNIDQLRNAAKFLR